MYEVHASPTPNVLKVLMALEEIEQPYRIRPVDVWRGQQFDEEFVRLNPNSKVPVLVDRTDADAPYVVIESGAILLYLAERAQRLLPPAGVERSEALQWLFFQTASVGPTSGQFNHFKMFAPPGTDYSLSRFTTELQRLYGVIDRRLENVPYLGGKAYGVADVALFPWVRNQAMRFGNELPFLSLGSGAFPELAQWYRDVDGRPATVRAVEAFGTIDSTLKLASPDQLDRVFGRGRYAADVATKVRH